jgi:hypothetical protein
MGFNSAFKGLNKQLLAAIPSETAADFKKFGNGIIR